MISRQKMQRLIVSKLDLNNNKLRLDSYLSTQLQCSKNQVQHLIKKQKVRINGIVYDKSGTLLKDRDIITLEIDNNATAIYLESHSNNVDFDIEILYKDDDILIINKPPNLVVHDAPSVKEPTLTDWLKAHSVALQTLSGEKRYGIVHRLDKQTSGVLAIAKSHLAYTKLPQELKDRQMGRYYLAIIDMPLKSNQYVQCFMGRNPHNRLKMSKINVDKKDHVPKGIRDSKSLFIKLATSNNGKCELIAIKLYTGRTHQIRTHLESLSRHILGDTLYGYKSSPDTYHYQNRIMLHSYILYLHHPKNLKEQIFKAPILTDMLEFLQTHFTKDMPDDCEDIMQLLEIDRIMSAFRHFS